METNAPTHFGRSEADWEKLTTEGMTLLVEQAKMQRTTTYTELNAVLGRRTHLRMFDFDQDSERAAVGHLLWLIIERERPISGHMISALVIYLNENDAGSGFYKLAQDYGVLAKDASQKAKEEFWLGEIKQLHARYGSP